MIKEIAENSLMSAFYQMIPYFKYFMGEDVGITMSNTEEYLFVQNTEKLILEQETSCRQIVRRMCA